MKKLFTLLTMLILGIGNMWGQQAVTAGAQVTDLANIVSGKAYLLQHQGNVTNKPWIEDVGIYYNCPNSAGNCKTASVWYLIKVSDGVYKIENAHTGKYWPKPTGNANLVGTTSDNAGEWTLNMTDGVCAPTCNGYGLNRNTPYLVGWNAGSGSVTQMEIFEVTGSNLSTATSYSELDAMKIVAGSEATSITEGQWYLLKNRGRSGYAYETNGTLKNTASFTKSSTTGAPYLVRFLNAGDGKYYIQNGLGNYFGAVAHNTAVPTTEIGTEKYTCGTIDNTAGHFYFTSATGGYVLDCQGNGNPVVGWNTTIPTTTGGNNDWALYPVTLNEIYPLSSDVWTINNTNNDRGAVMYAPTQSTQYVWSSGKNSQTFDPSSSNCQWVIYPTETDEQYYLYNVGAGKFAIPTNIAAGSGYPWVFSDNAVAVKLEKQNDGTYKIKMAKDPVSGTNAAYMAVSNNYAGPIINYNDEGGNFTITKVSGQSSAADAAVAKLIKNQTALTTYPQETGWYAIQIKSNGNVSSYAGRYVQNSTSLHNNLYPLTFTGGVDIQPAITDPTFFTHFDCRNWSDNYWQLPDGRYLVKNDNNKFPTVSNTATAIVAGYEGGNYFKSGYYYADPYNSGANYFIGETSTYRSKYTVYPIDLDAAGITAWKVMIADAAGTETLTCNRSDVSGLTTVYNNGYIFLPTNVTPVASEFSATGISYGYQIKINEGAKMIYTLNIDKLFDAQKNATKFDILDGSTVMGPSEFAAPASINAAIDAAQKVADNNEAKLAFIESDNGKMIQNYLNQVATWGALANIQITMSKEYGTLILPCPCTRIDGLDIYSCSGRENNTLTLTPVAGNYNQNVPYIIHATEGSKYTIIGWDNGSTDTHTEGWLTGALNSTTDIPNGSYMLATNKTTKVQAFYKVTGSGVKCAINKCYLTVPSSDPVVEEARTLYLDIDGQVTAIEEVFGDETEQGAIYNLAGQRLTKAQKGINIINGKKVIK